MSDMLSQEEINALLSGASPDDESSSDGLDDAALDTMLTSEQKDALGEVGNISMGTSATTLFALLSQKVQITTPQVSVVRWRDISKDYEKPCVGIRVNYTEGIRGTNVLLLKQHDVKVITSLMMGWGGVVEDDSELTEIDLSAISEAMNQMIGSSSTSLSSLTKERIDIDTPVAFEVDFNKNEHLENLAFDQDYAVCVKFRMEIGDLIDSDIMQLLPMQFALHLVDVMKSYISSSNAAEAAPAAQKTTSAPAATQQQVTPPPQAQNTPMQAAPPQQQQYAQPQQQYAQQPTYYNAPPVDARPAQFQNFDMNDIIQQKENIEIIMDVPLEVTVELGRTSKKIKEILEFSPGSIIELNKLAGEPIDILVNGKFVAKGEVVVIDENFGIKVTNIINAEYRI